MKYFFLKLISPRPDFMWTMTDAERAIMQRHSEYWRGFAEKGWAVAYGPVAAPSGEFGAGFWQLPEGVDPKPLTDDDPAMKANVGFQYEVYPMPALVIGKAAKSAN